ncbi:ribose 5-phosphate isomerase A [Clostridium nigeriense]|uniref:ribose 5-phosphate isomerase A n=1 Tax=Clostridium nigeriense TaxID=1805470 RepID=UPI003D337061
MDIMKKRCAKEALKYIKDNSIIGLGGGSTISHLVNYIKEEHIKVKVVTPSFSTENICIKNGIEVIPTWSVSSIDIAFDGCDEVDYDLNALKSGGGIHTKEKIIAKMANEYILLVDESKVVEKIDFKYPIVLEVIPESMSYVKKVVGSLGGDISMRSSNSKDGLALSDHGMFLMDVIFDKNKVESIEKLDKVLNEISGVIDTSLFYNIATKALVVSENGIREIKK